jgi:hypothetical protein
MNRDANPREGTFTSVVQTAMPCSAPALGLVELPRRCAVYVLLSRSVSSGMRYARQATCMVAGRALLSYKGIVRATHPLSICVYSSTLTQHTQTHLDSPLLAAAATGHARLRSAQRLVFCPSLPPAPPRAPSLHHAPPSLWLVARSELRRVPPQYSACPISLPSLYRG